MHLSGAQPVPPNVRKKNILSWALTRTGSVVFIRQVSPQHPAPLLHAHAHFLFLFGTIVFLLQKFQKKIFRIVLVLFYSASLQLWIFHKLKCHASPGQRRGICGHMMAGFDQHECCARCRNKGLGSDPCVQKKFCSICDNLTDQQQGMLSTPQYQIRKDKKAGLLVSPSKVTVVGVVDQGATDMPEDAPDPSSGSGPQEVFQISHHSADDFVSRKDLDVLSNQLEEKFARFDALLSCTNVFSSPKVPVNAMSAPVSDQPFFMPSDPRATGPVRSPGPDEDLQRTKTMEKKNKGPGKKGKKSKPVSSATSSNLPTVPDKSPTGSLSSSQPAASAKVDIPGPGAFLSLGQGSCTSSFVLTTAEPQPAASGTFGTGSGPFLATAPDDSDVESVTGRSDKDSEEGEISETEQNEEMNYREMVRAVRAFLGWSHIPDFEYSATDGDRSDNPWKGKHPRKMGKISVELPAEDWLCHKMEKLNTRVAEGYPSGSQESAGLFPFQSLSMFI